MKVPTRSLRFSWFGGVLLLNVRSDDDDWGIGTVTGVAEESVGRPGVLIFVVGTVSVTGI